MNTSAPQNTNKSRNDKVNQNIQVYVRVRPLNAREKLMRSNEIIDVSSPREIICRHSIDSKVTKKFSFDRTFGPESKQSEVYHTVVSPLIEEVLAGYNCTVFAYGQTGTGKTHTMVGVESPELKNSWEDDSSVGIIPRALCHMLDELRLMEVEYTMRISYLELYNEELCDLLSTDESVKIRIFDDSTKKGSVIIQGLEEVIVHGKDDVYKLLEKGQDRRKTASTLMNAQSSRSHTVFSILVHIRENGIDGEEMLKIGKLNLVDLAGSENISKAGNEKGIRTRETVNINQSLLTLGRVITSLVERTPHIPYRESKLTRLLQESLGGRTKTSIIATISPGHKDIDETLSTLEYAHRAKNIQNKPEVNQKLTKKTVLKEYTEEIDRLKRDLLAARDKNGIYLAEDTYNEINYKLENQNKELNEKMLVLKAMKEEMLKKEALFNEVSITLVERTQELQKTEKVLSETKNDLNLTKKVLNTTKKRYKEKKILLGNHIKTEEKLTDQATQLIQVAEIATHDHVLLQDTLERRKNVDTQIKNVTGEFKNRMESSFREMNRDIKDLQEKHKTISKVLTDEISKNTKSINSNIKNTNEKIKNLSIHCETAFDGMYSFFEEFAKELINEDEKFKDKFEKFQVIQRDKENMWRKELDNYIKGTTKILLEQKTLQENNVGLLSKLISEENRKDHKFCETLSDHLQEIISQAQKAINDEREKINQNAKKGSELNKKEKDIVSKIKKLLCNLEDLEAEKNERIEEVQEISKNMESIERELPKKIEQEINATKIYIESKDNDFVECEGNLKRIQNDHNSAISRAQEQIDNCEKTISTMYDSCLEFENEVTSMLFENNETRKDLINSKKDALQTEKNNLASSIQIECRETENVIFKIGSSVNENALHSSSLTKSMHETLNDYSEIYFIKMDDNHHQLNAFYENELKTYTPTGQTPSKKEFTYPKVLARTSPHSNIIKRFRLENDYSDHDISNTTISEEGDESTILEMGNEMPRRSTPIKSYSLEANKSLDSTMHMSTENNSRLTNSLNMYESKHFSILNRNSPALCSTANKENFLQK